MNNSNDDDDDDDFAFEHAKTERPARGRAGIDMLRDAERCEMVRDPEQRARLYLMGKECDDDGK